MQHARTRTIWLTLAVALVVAFVCAGGANRILMRRGGGYARGNASEVIRFEPLGASLVCEQSYGALAGDRVGSTEPPTSSHARRRIP